MKNRERAIEIVNMAEAKMRKMHPAILRIQNNRDTYIVEAEFEIKCGFGDDEIVTMIFDEAMGDYMYCDFCGSEVSNDGGLTGKFILTHYGTSNNYNRIACHKCRDKYKMEKVGDEE